MVRSVARWRQPLREEHRSVSTLSSDLRAESGQTMAEYAVVLGVITIAVVVTLRLLSTGIKNTLTNVIGAL
jgi:Flp pilus assembly pilin Flp